MEANITKLAKKLRRGQTDAESLLWKHLRTKQMEGVKFRRQEPIGRFIVDFVSFEKKVIVEVDGGQHSEEADKEREQWLRSQGFKVLRFWNNEVLENTEGVLEVIRNNSSLTLP
jgi:very-short-patch-repair endonuclease